MKKFFLLIAVHILFLNAVFPAGSFGGWNDYPAISHVENITFS